MRFWPSRKKQLQRLIIFFLSISSAAFFLLAILFLRVKNLAKAPPCETVSSRHLDSGSPFCPQQIGSSGWILEEGKIRIFPRCLTVMNSRFGSRFNLDWYFGSQRVTSGVLGTFEDKNTYLTLRLEDGNDIVQIFPILANSHLTKISTDLGLTYQQINFDSQDFLVSLKITSPFSPTKAANETDNKMNSSPFFYLDLELDNKTPKWQSKRISLSLEGAEKISETTEVSLVYFNDGTRGDAALTLASLKEKKSAPYIQDKQGGFTWQVTVGPKSSWTTSLVYAGFLKGTALTETKKSPVRELKFAYQHWFANIEEIIKFAFANQKNFLRKTNRFEESINQKNLSPSVKWLLAQAFHSYLGNTWLVCQEGCRDFEYYVWEGEFKYLNTLDVAHDYAVLEGLYFPWVLKSELVSWQNAAKKDKKGVVIPHDLGARFNLKGSQAYPPGDWQTSSMPVEENANFILLSYWYWQQSGDDEFIRNLAPFLHQLVVSLVKRDTNNNGIADKVIGITTYDNDGNVALQAAPDSSYLAIKQLAAYSAAAEIFRSFNQEKFFNQAYQQAKLISNSLEKIYQSLGFIPLSLDPQFSEKYLFENKKILGIEEQGFAFISGLFYPAITKMKSEPIAKIVPALADSFSKAYEKSLLRDKSGQLVGLQLAQYQALNLGWFSHSVLAQAIAQKLFGQEYQSEEIFFPLLYDNPYSFADGYYFKEPFYPPKITLSFYPRGAAIFALLVE